MPASLFGESGANKTDNTVSEIDVGRRLVVATLGVGSAPAAFGNFVGRAQPASALLAAVLPGAAVGKTGKTATVNATLLNTGTARLNDCRIPLPTSAPAGVSMVYATTNSGGTVNSGPNPAVSIAGNGSQAFQVQFTSTKPALEPAQPLLFVCAGTSYAPIVLGVNTVYLQFAHNPAAAVDAVAATASGNGIVEIPLSSGQQAAFIVVSENVGAAGKLVVTADTGTVALPVTISLCQTRSNTGQCMAPPAASVVVHFVAGATPTFTVFVAASAAIPLDPDNSGIFVRFLDQSLGPHGLTSVAVETN